MSSVRLFDCLAVCSRSLSVTFLCWARRSFSPTVSPVGISTSNIDREAGPRGAGKEKRTGGGGKKTNVKGAESGSDGLSDNTTIESDDDDNAFVWEDDEADFEDKDRRLVG